jgi:NADH-quinone oxidoreductase subunit K
MVISISFWLYFTFILFCLGFISLLFNNQNFLHVLLSFELSLVGLSSSYLGFSMFCLDLKGQIYAIVIIVISAAESCIGLALVVVLLKAKGNISVIAFSDTPQF